MEYKKIDFFWIESNHIAIINIRQFNERYLNGARDRQFLGTGHSYNRIW